jgi:pentose-5-phosphate-3-epimerase
MSTNQDRIADRMAQIQAKSVLISAEKDDEKRQKLIKQKKKLEYQLQIDRIRQLIINLG